jgi:tetratricopeptide (TPR) repeat protein
MIAYNMTPFECLLIHNTAEKKTLVNVKKTFVSHQYWIVALLLLIFVSGCGGTPTEVPPTALPTLVPTGPPPAPTETPAPTPTSTAVPQAPTATAAPEAAVEAQDDWQPLSPDACHNLANAMAQALGVDVATAEAPFQDHVSGKAGIGCQAIATGTGLDFESFMAVADRLREMLRYQRWREDFMYAADGPTGTGAGFQRAGELCLLTVGWEPSQDADCPQDQPISACQLAPEQQLYTIELNCAQDAAAAELRSMIAASLPLTPTPDASGFSPGGIAEVGVLPLTVSSGSQPLWAVFSVGMRGFTDPPQDHFIAIYAHSDAGWQELTRLELAGNFDPEAFEPSPDYVFEGSLRQVNVEPSRIWLQLEGGAGAHGGTYHLLSFDGQVLKIEATNSTASPGGNRVEDLNGDGLQEVVLDATDAYVFCYACSVRLVNFTVLRWDGSQLAEVPLTPLPESASADLRDLNNRAVELAQGELWKDALATIEQAQALDAQDETVVWNAALIRLTAEGRRPPYDYESIGYPLLDRIFYGDYAAALDVVGDYGVEELFGQPSPLVVGTVVEGWEDALVQRIQDSTTRALQVQPDLAAAWFLRGWATHLGNPDSPQALADIERAAELDPNEPLFAQSIAYLKGM